MDFRVPNRIVWYAEGFRWIGSLFDGVADRLEREAAWTQHLPAAADHQAEVIEATRNRLLSYL
jgi:hypothetical protein